MGEFRNNHLKCVAPGTDGLIGDRNKILLPDGSGYNRKTDTVTVCGTATFKVYVRKEVFFGLGSKWLCVADIKNGQGTARGTLVIK